MYERTQDGELGEEAAGAEELRLRLVELLMELEETRQDSSRHKENFVEMRSEKPELAALLFKVLHEVLLDVVLDVVVSHVGGRASGSRPPGGRVQPTN